MKEIVLNKAKLKPDEITVLVLGIITFSAYASIKESNCFSIVSLRLNFCFCPVTCLPV